MLCKEFETRLQHLLDLRTDPESDDQLQTHVRLCSSCREQLATVSRLLDGLDLLEVPPLPDDFARRVVDQVVPASRKKTNARWITFAAAIAATLLIALFSSIWNDTKQSPQTARDVQRGPRDPAGIAQVPPSRMREADDAAGDGWWMVPRDSIRELSQLYPEETRERHRQRVNQFADDLRPIATPFNAAMTAIRRTIPVRRNRDTSEPSASLTPVGQVTGWS
jgi:hypothetical protein